jgi:trans-aconitate methyltransferase
VGDAERRQALVFGEVAETYHEARSGYPAQLVDDVVAFGNAGPGDRVLEVGGGTGKATAAFAARELTMLCLEPSLPMAEIARRTCASYPNVTIELTSFEGWEPERQAFRLLIAAQAWHWVAPDVRYRKAHQVLAPGGAIALFWNWPDWDDSGLMRELDDVYDRHVPGIEALGPTHAGGRTRKMDEDFATELAASGLFDDVSAREYPWTEAYRTDGYLQLLSTHSDHRMLPDELRSKLLHAVGEVLDGHGGEITLKYLTRLYLARPV